MMIVCLIFQRRDYMPVSSDVNTLRGKILVMFWEAETGWGLNLRKATGAKSTAGPMSRREPRKKVFRCSAAAASAPCVTPGSFALMN